MEKINAVITGIGGYVPEYVLNNDELSRMVDTNDEWIMTRIGVKERRILNEEGLGTSYMARKAAKQLLQKTGVNPEDIDCVIVSTSTPDYHFPSVASIVIGKLGLTNAFAYDLQAACSGFLFAMDTASALIQSGRYKKIIVIGADKMSSMVDYTDRATCPIFGDGAAAVLVEPTTEDLGWKDSYLRTDGKGLPFLCMKAGGSACPPSYFTINVFAACQFNHLWQIIRRLPDIDLSVGRNIEKCNGLSGLFLLTDGCKGFIFCCESLLRFLFMSRQKSIKFHPFCPSKGIFLITGVICQDRNTKFLQLFLHFRCMGNHGIFNGKLTVF